MTIDQPYPDVDLVQAVADALSEYDGTTDFSWEDMARAALAVVRESHHAKEIPPTVVTYTGHGLTRDTRPGDLGRTS